MKFTSAIGALGASSMLLSGVGAVDLDINSPDSIKQAAKTISANLRSYYTGDRKGDTPGNLPDPYYWWECGAMFNAFIDYWYYTGDDQYNAITTQALQHQIGDYNAFMPPNQTKTLGNDDQGFWGMAAMSAAENKLPDLGSGNPSWLSLAQAVFNTQKDRWDNSTCGGGLRWQIFTFNNGYNYKNTISNGCFFNIASRLYKYLGNQTYADWAERAWEWELSVGLMSKDYHYFDGTDDTTNCTNIQAIQWTYNAGVHMAGAAAMWNVTQNDLWKGRTVVLVTHHVGLCLPGADYVVSLKDGKVDQACEASDAKIDKLELEELEQPPDSPLSPQDVLSPFSPKPVDRDDFISPVEPSPARQIYTTEYSSTGRVATSHYLLVLLSAGPLPYWLIFGLLYASNELFAVLKTVYLKTWSESVSSSTSSNNTNLAIYAILVGSGAIFGGVRWFWLYGIGGWGFYNRGSRVIHKRLLDLVCSAPMSWFEKTPAGRIMNIFGQDVNRLDASSADDFARTLSSALAILTSVAFVCFQAPSLLIILVLFGSPLYWLSGVLIKLRADLKRLTAICGSPVITLYHDAIDGIVMIRAFGSCDLMMASMQALVNRERQAFSADWMVYNWVKGMIRAIASVFVTATGFALVRSEMSGAQAGLILSFAMSTSTGLFTLLEQNSNLEQTFVSAERINQYLQNNETEPTTGQIPPPSWPSTGSIKFKDLSIRYAPDLPEVLHKVNFTVEPGMRVGLVGSTGSGKSTLALALFRAIEAFDGGIEIDGLDIADVQLGELRRRLNMVAQDGSLSSGTLREALDITGLKDDREVYEALRRVHLLPEEITKEVVQDNPFANLDTFVAVEGANFSQGQRQLLCLARALLKQSRILVMDEATSSVDFEMDAKITATIRECFAGTTMIVIAHRLATIMQYDRVLVLDKGHVLEYGSPLELIQNEHSKFHGLCMAAGEEEFEKLLAMAKLG